MKDKCDFFVDGVYAASIDDTDSMDEMYDRLMPSGNYKQIISSTGGYSGYRVFFSENEMRAHTVFWKQNSGFVDKNGNTLYVGDIVEDEHGYQGTVDINFDYDFRKNIKTNVRYLVRSSNLNNALTKDYAKTLERKEKAIHYG